MSYYAKHPEHGNRHFEEVDRAALEAEGWVFFPHPEGNMPAYKEDEPKRKPGRPRKVQLSGDSGA